MKTNILLFVFLFFVFNGVKAQVDAGDSLALVDLYNSTGGAGWYRNLNWLTDKPVDKWYGIQVVNRKVISIALGGDNLRGILPTSICNFDSLVELNLYQNELSGGIPDSIGNLTSLEVFNLSINLLSGTIPSGIGKLVKLHSLSIIQNKLSGELPASIGNCTLLTGILLSDNELTGSLPSSFKKLVLLQELNLTRNKLSGELEDVFAENCPLQYLILGQNQFTGVIPDFLSRYTKMYQLDLSHNHLSGPVPRWLNTLREIKYLYLHQNQLSGNLEINFANLPYASLFSLFDNQLTFDNNPQYSGRLLNSATVYLDKNRLTFNGLEYLVKKYKAITYSKQALLSTHVHKERLSVSAGGTLSNNVYTWFQVGKSSGHAIAGDSTFTPTESGSYYCTITNRIVTKLTLFTDTVTYLTNPIAKNELNVSLSPNPARGMISIYGLNEKADLKITIADMSGYVWLTTMSHRQSTIRADVSRLKAGNYLVSVNDGQGMKTVEMVKE